MAIDTAAKRASALNAFKRRRVLPIPDGTIGQGDRQHAAGFYSGILAADVGRYNLYRAATQGGLLTNSPIATNIPGDTDFVIAHADDTDWWYGITTVSSMGIENRDEMRVIFQSVAGGSLAGPLPNAVTWSRVRPVADGAIELTFEYDATGQPGKATGIQVFRATGPDAGGADFDSPLETISIPGSISKKVTLADSYAHGETVWIVLRAVTALGDQGSVNIPENSPVVADAVGPAANSRLVASQG